MQAFSHSPFEDFYRLAFLERIIVGSQTLSSARLTFSTRTTEPSVWKPSTASIGAVRNASLAVGRKSKVVELFSGLFFLFYQQREIVLVQNVSEHRGLAPTPKILVWGLGSAEVREPAGISRWKRCTACSGRELF